VPDLATFQAAFSAAIGRRNPRGAFERQPGFAVYRNTGPAALIDALRGQYPVVAEILGEESFARTAFAFSRANPPTSAILVAYGASFSDFLAEQDFAADLPYLADVAAIERLRTEALLAADAEPLGLTDFGFAGDTGWAEKRLPLHPAARFAWLTTPAFTIWSAHIEGFETLAPEWRAEGVLVARTAAGIQVAPIDPAEHRLPSGMRLRETTGQASAATAALYPTADIFGIFTRLVTRGDQHEHLAPSHLREP